MNPTKFFKVASVCNSLLLAHKGGDRFVALSQMYTPDLMKDLLKGNPLVDVRDTGTAKGKGVFATQAITKGDIITLYPVHMLLYRGTPKVITNTVFWPDGIPESRQVIDDYKVCIGEEDENMDISANPHLPINPLACGHMLNDPAPLEMVEKMMSTKPSDGCEVIGKRFWLYYMVAAPLANAEFMHDTNKLVKAVRATRDIAEGEEVTVCYEATYWLVRDVSNRNEMYDALRQFYQEKCTPRQQELFGKLLIERVMDKRQACM